MKQSHIKPIQHYNLLLRRLRPWGLYQVRLVILMAFYWFFSGLNQSIFEITLTSNLTSIYFCLDQAAQVTVITISVMLSLRFPRNKINTVINILFLTGGFLVALGSHFESDPTE